MFKYLLFSLLRAADFFKRLFFGLILNYLTLAATALYETYNIPIVKKYSQFIYFIFFSERKLYGFLQSELLHFVFVYEVNAVLNIFCLDVHHIKYIPETAIY